VVGRSSLWLISIATVFVIHIVFVLVVLTYMAHAAPAVIRVFKPALTSVGPCGLASARSCLSALAHLHSTSPTCISSVTSHLFSLARRCPHPFAFAFAVVGRSPPSSSPSSSPLLFLSPTSSMCLWLVRQVQRCTHHVARGCCRGVLQHGVQWVFVARLTCSLFCAHSTSPSFVRVRHCSPLFVLVQPRLLSVLAHSTLVTLTFRHPPSLGPSC
jgi:hypothetical protein